MFNTTSIAVAPINAQASAAAGNPLATVFRPKPAVTSTSVSSSNSLPAGVNKAIATAETLIASYSKLKVDVLDRSDRALWALLQDVYAYADAVEKSLTKRETRGELIRQIRLRDDGGVSTAASTAAIVIRYIFADQSRQTRSNYSIAMEKATALGVTTDSFAGFLEQFGGVSKVVERIFDHESEDADNAAATTKQLREEKQSRIGLVGRLCTVMAHASSDQLEYSGEPNNWVPEKPKKSDKSANKEEKADPKYEQGKFVVFLTVKDPQSGKYRVVQGNVFNRAFEDQLLGTIAEQMGASNDELANVVVGLEQSIGFNAQ
jgi:hypothetical protein